MMAAAEEETTEMTEIQKKEEEAEKTQEQENSQTSADPATPEATEGKEAEDPEEELPPLTYIDFLPQCFGSRLEGSDPVYATFQTVVEQANQWLRSTPEFSAVKCETVDYKLNPIDFSLQPDFSLQHFSSNGKNIYVKGLRLWLMPRTDETLPVQQLGYITVLPDHSSGNLITALTSIQPAALRFNPEQVFGEFDTMTVTMEKLNQHLQQKPLPGRILTVETLCLKAAESEQQGQQLQTESTLWTQSGKASRLYLFATRIFYVVGPPAFEKLCYHDEVPDALQLPEDFGMKVKFAPFSHTVSHAAVWLAAQKNMRAVNFQTVTLKIERPGGVGPFKINPEVAGFKESQALQESRYVKILRVFYVRDQKADAPALYQSVRLSTRLFVPQRAAAGARSFETFSKTVERVIAWLKATGTPVLGMETVRYPVNPEGEQSVSGDRVDSVITGYSGHYSLTCVRLFFPYEFQEPPPEVMPQTEEDYWGWACVVS